MIRTFQKWAGVAILSLSFLGCSSEREAGEILAFQMDFLCRSDQVTACDTAALARSVRLGLELNPTLNCADLLSTVGAAQLHLNFQYVADTTAESYGVGQVWGRFLSYQQNQGPATTFSPGQYRACAYIDLNSNGFMDTGEPLMSTIWNPSLDIDRIFTDWSPAP